MRRLIAWGVMATAAIFIAAVVHFYWHPRSAKQVRPPVPAMPSKVVQAQPVVDLAGEAPKDLKATEADRISQGAAPREFTTEQKARLDSMRTRFGELQAKIAICQQVQGDLRVSAMGRPEIHDAVVRFKAAREELERQQASVPARAGAELKVREAEAGVAQAQNARGMFEVHRTAHLTDGPDAHKDCGWCYRDAERIKVKDPALTGVYAKEEARIDVAVAEAGAARQAAVAAAAAAMQKALSEPGLVAMRQKAIDAQSALSAQIEGVPEFANSRSEERAAREEQQKLADEITALYAEVNAPDGALMASRPDAGGAKVQ